MVARALLGLISLLLAVAGRAHDPGLSTGRIEIKPTEVIWTVAFAPADAEWLLPLDQRGRGEEEIKRWLVAQASGLLSVMEEGVPLASEKARVEVHAGDNVEIQLRWARGQGRKLSFAMGGFPALPAGHRNYATVVSEAGELLAETLLHARAPAISVEVPPAAMPEVATGSVPVPPPSPAPSRWSAFVLFFGLGVEHILIGYDHLLFLFGLLVVCTRWRTIAVIITSFTIGHSVTLILATFGTVSIPANIVEPAIAASIVLIAGENLARRGAEPRGRGWVALVLGLVHGFGFATVLRDLGVAEAPGGVLVPLASFNLGVEAGQLLVGAAVLPLLQWGRRRAVVTERTVAAISVVVGGAGLYWLVARTLLA